MNIKQIIEEEIESFLKENDDHIYRYYEERDEIYHDIYMQMLNKDTTKIRLRRIKPSMYQQALNEFMKMGEIVRYPTKYIYDWKNIIITNTIYLDIITELWGHSPYFDVDMFNDYVLNTDDTGKSVNDWNEAMEYLEEKGYYNILDEFLPKFSNGHDLISDYGLESLKRVVEKLMQTEDPNEILVLVNKALDISHQRSDLSELFIEGGQASLNKISGLDESKNNNMKIKNIIKEEMSNFDFLGMEKMKEEENLNEILNSRNFQTKFITDVINDFNNKILFKDMDVIYDSSNDEEITSSDEILNIEYNVELKYNYKDTIVNLKLYFTGSNIDYKINNDGNKEKHLTDINWESIDINIFDNEGNEIDFSWLEKNPVLKSRFVRKFIEQTLDFDISMR